MQDIVLSIQRGYPLSVVAYRHQSQNALRFACVMSKNKQWTLHFFRIIIQGNVYPDPNGYLYFPIELCPIGVKVAKEGSLQLDGHIFDSFAIMLPDLWHHRSGDRQYKYAMVNEDWKKMDQHRGWTSLFSH